jgi:hypothetical protein
MSGRSQGSWVRREVGKDFRDNPGKVLGMDIDLKVSKPGHRPHHPPTHVMYVECYARADQHTTHHTCAAAPRPWDARCG